MRRALALLFVLQAAGASAATFTVTNTSDSGAGSLRLAITDANAASGADTIAFNVSGAGCVGGVCTITPMTNAYPFITGPVTIDGYTQPGSSPNTNAQGALNTVLRIVVSGTLIPGAQAFHFTAGATDSTLRGLAINGGFANPVRVQGANFAVRGCFIGTDVTGMTASSGGSSAVLVQGFDGATSTTVGGPSPADRNLIAAHGTGVFFDHVPNGLIQGNLFGTDATGAATIGTLANNCIAISPGDQGTAVRGNVLASGGLGGITIGNASDSASETVIQGNFIGTDVTGTIALGNGQSGIHIWTTDVIVGGTGPGEGNVIAFNKGAGVLLIFYAPNRAGRCTIRGNSIYSNHHLSNIGNQCLGIDFQEGVPSCDPTLNDLGDGDTGPNGGQNFPIITSAVSSIVEGGTTITGRFNSAANTIYTLDFYGNAACAGRPQDFREGETYLGSDDIMTDGSGNAAINVILPVTLDDDTLVTATATDPDGNTSEFSQRIVLRSTPGVGAPDRCARHARRFPLPRRGDGGRRRRRRDQRQSSRATTRSPPRRRLCRRAASTT